MLRQAVRQVSCQARGAARRFSAESGEKLPPRFEKTVNQVNLLGRLGRDAEERGTEAHPVVVFSMATNAYFARQSGDPYSRIDWHRISVFKDGLREKVAANLKKGDRVFVTGTIQYSTYQDAKNNMQRATNIIASDMINLTKRYLQESMDVPVVEEASS